ncbi:flavin reductase family protein [Deinococcus pimensis]|uniref:flavin reductase family protein n=1 Tax=Deinococcus pimensis TaxID=309888 RepID=UPI0005EB5882|nr:flavin reductase family protein [Deinococcus pimensis]
MTSPTETIVIEPRILYFGTPVVLLSTLNEDGSTNLSVLSSAWALGQRVVLGIGTQGQALRNLERHPECVINLPSADLWAAVERLAPTTGRAEVPEAKRVMNYRYEHDKFALAGFTRVASEQVRPDRVLECPLQLEGQVVALHPPAHAQADAFRIVEVEVHRVHAHPEVVQPGTHHVDITRWQPLLYVFRHYFGTGAELGRNFRADT